MQEKGFSLFLREFRKNWQLHVLLLLPLLYILIFSYGPMYGVQIAFRDYSARKGIWGSEWVGLTNFVSFFNYYGFKNVVGNTLALSAYSLAVGFPLPVLFSLMLNTLRSARYRKFAQTLTYIPHFISVVVLVGILNQMLNPISGAIGSFYKLIGGIGYQVDIRSSAEAFRHLYVWSDIWQHIGWDTIIYTAALASVSPELHEAAQIDGATRLQRVLHVDFPSILPTAAIMLILRCGSVMTVGFEKVYLMQNDLNLSTAEVISTYVYKVGLGAGGDFSYAAAIGLFNAVINCVLLLSVNFLSKKMSSDEVGLF